jgi:glycosyltransferase involved in cell wall biosynthesis
MTKGSYPAIKASPLLVFVVNNASFFVSHRLPLALHAASLGWRVVLITGQASTPALEATALVTLASHAIEHRRVAFESAGTRPTTELHGLWQLIRHLKQLRPDLVHCVSPKGIMYGGMAARLAGARNVVYAVSGMGYAFTQDSKRLTLKRRLVNTMASTLSSLAYAHPRKAVIVQNQDDEQALQTLGWAQRDQITRIPGSGIVLSQFTLAPIEPREPLIVLPARMLRDKGVFEFAQAAQALKGAKDSRGEPWRFVLAGTADHDNPSTVSKQALMQWVNDGALAWLGHVDDMPSLLARASIVCLPSYREGMPKSLLEAAASGCAVVTTDAIGCREAVASGVTGDLVPVADAQALTLTLKRLMDDDARRKRYGIAGRQRAIELFSIDAVVNRTFTLYEHLLGTP